MTEGKKARKSEEKYGRYIRKKLGEVRTIFAALNPFPSYQQTISKKSNSLELIKADRLQKDRRKGQRFGKTGEKNEH